MDFDAFIITPSDVGLPPIVEIGDNIVREANAVENLVPNELYLFRLFLLCCIPLTHKLLPQKTLHLSSKI